MNKVLYYLLRLLRFFNQLKNNHRSFRILREKFYRNRWYAAASEIKATIDVIGSDFLKIEKNGISTFVLVDQVMLDSCVHLKIVGNKTLTYSIINQLGFRTPKHIEFDLISFGDAKKILQDTLNPVVIKPAYGSGAGHGITTGVCTNFEFFKASLVASQYCPKLLVEEQIPGNSYRLLFLNGELLDVIRRDPPSVLGDGKSSIKKLIINENKRRLTDKTCNSVNPLHIDKECKLWLKENGLSLASIPQKGEKIIVKRVVNQNGKEDNRVVRDQVCDEILLQCQDIISYIGITLAGVDIIASRLDVSLEKSGGVINEINTTPGLHHHFLINEEDKAFPIFTHILDYLLSH
jgi:cyanophycin synthetase